MRPTDTRNLLICRQSVRFHRFAPNTATANTRNRMSEHWRFQKPFAYQIIEFLFELHRRCCQIFADLLHIRVLGYCRSVHIFEQFVIVNRCIELVRNVGGCFVECFGCQTTQIRIVRIECLKAGRTCAECCTTWRICYARRETIRATICFLHLRRVAKFVHVQNKIWVFSLFSFVRTVFHQNGEIKTIWRFALEWWCWC